jgi:hypothetical protein
MKALKYILVCAVVTASALPSFADQAMRIVFSKTKASAVIHSVATRTGYNVIFSGSQDPEISLNVKANSPEEALKFVSAAAGLSMKKVGASFVIAGPDEMRDALRPFAESKTLELKAADAESTAKAVEQAFPYVTASGSHGLLVLHALPEDQKSAVEFVIRIEKEAASQSTMIYTAKHVPTDGLGDALTAMFDTLKVSVVDPVVGTIAISGSEAEVKKALKMAGSLDIEIPLPPEEPIVLELYNVRYSSAPALKLFLQEAEPEVQVMIGPESFSPGNPGFQPLSSTSVQGSLQSQAVIEPSGRP